MSNHTVAVNLAINGCIKKAEFLRTLERLKIGNFYVEKQFCRARIYHLTIQLLNDERYVDQGSDYYKQRDRGRT
jgi:hypothetical protein